MPIRERKERGTWVVDYLDATGRRRRISAKDEEDAQLLLADKIRERRNPRPIINRETTVAEYAEQWLDTHVAGNLKPATRRNYRWSITTIVVPALGRVKLCELRRRDVKDLLNDQRTAGLSKASIQSIRGALSSMLSAALDDEIITANVAASIGRRGGKRADTQTAVERAASIRPFAQAEVAALIAGCADAQGRAFLTLQARAGLRPGEALGLQWSDLNFSKREILIERAYHEGELSSPKTGEPRRVDMSGDLATALVALYRERERQELQGHRMSQWVFCDRAGKPLLKPVIDRVFHHAMRRAGLSGHTLYDLRHTFASTLLAKGIPLTYVSHQLGHAKPTTTLKYYAHFMPSADQRFVDALDADFGTNFGTKMKKVLGFQGLGAEGSIQAT